MLIILSLTGCSTNISNGNTEEQNNTELSAVDISRIDLEETYPEAPGQLETKYENISEIILDAQLITKVTVTNQTIEMLGGYPQTHSMVEVKEVYMGDVEAGDILEIVEEGGYEGSVLGGIPQLNSENSYVLFLKAYNEKYYICGAFQGRFIEREGYLFQQATSDVKLKTYYPLKVSDFSEYLKELIDKR